MDLKSGRPSQPRDEIDCRALREARRRSRLTARQVAEMLDISKNAIYRWEHCNSRPPREVVIALASLYNVSRDSLKARKQV